jgi:hypothetical protein
MAVFWHGRGVMLGLIPVMVSPLRVRRELLQPWR